MVQVRRGGWVVLLAGLGLLLYWHSGRSEPDSEGAEAVPQERLKPFSRGRPSSIPMATAEAALSQGKPWFFSAVAGSVGTGKAVIDVDAPTDVVWRQLLDFSSYPKKVNMLSNCEVYKREKDRKSERIFARFVSPVLPGYKFVYHCDHTFEPAKQSITWTLDWNKKNDMDDVQGHWHVEPHPSNKDQSRVFYEVKLQAPRYLPRMVIDVLTKKAIQDATTWVRKFSELEAAEMRNKQ
eukprot:TRINITY_DN94138_c0_g1_i1.p1 TRINITY_DN94138_c0_g1~~TRINITY_DN94138_c0_g1_i1.p1  ORF type:complete len:237 (-),score=41.24 TRINITY_DN94138_c0_g1_i1:101-811(-)